MTYFARGFCRFFTKNGRSKIARCILGYDRYLFPLFVAIGNNAFSAAGAAVPKGKHLVGIIDDLTVTDMGCAAAESSVIGFEYRHLDAFLIGICLGIRVDAFGSARDYFGDVRGDVFFEIFHVKIAETDYC